MEPTSPELDTIADLLRRWQQVDGPMDRVRIVSAAADALRGLSTLDARTLAQGLWEHGAGPAAQQVADRMGRDVAPEELAETASAVLSLDRAEVERFAHELRDPEQRRRLLIDSGIAPEEAAQHVASAPPDDRQRIDAPPPPGAEPSAASQAALEDQARTEHRDTGPASIEPGSDARPRDGGRHDGAEAASHEAATTPRGRRPAPADAFPEPPEIPPSVTPERGRHRDGRRPSHRLADRLHDAANGRERLLLLDEDDMIVHGAATLRILDAVPDGWQRRTVLRKLIAAGRVRDLPAGEVVERFGRRGDRFAAAALLVRTGACSPEDILPSLDPNDAERLRRRASALSLDR